MSSASALYGFSEALGDLFPKIVLGHARAPPSARERGTAAWTAAFEMRVCDSFAPAPNA
jgi:hypothetical protein